MAKPVILCIDDERIILDALKNQLRHGLGDGYLIEVAESGEEALEIVAELCEQGISLPLVIADQIMTGMYGDAVLAHIKAQLPDTLSIMLTGQATAESVGKALNTAGLYRYLSKPWQEEDLVMTVRSALDKYVQTASLRRQNAYQQIVNEVLQLALQPESTQAQMTKALGFLLAAPDFKGHQAGALYLSDKQVSNETGRWQCLTRHGELQISDEWLDVSEQGAYHIQVCQTSNANGLQVVKLPLFLDDKVLGLLFLEYAYRSEFAESFYAFLQAIAHCLTGMLRLASYHEALEAHSATLEEEVAARTEALNEALRLQEKQNESLQSLNRELEFYATTDELTGLTNRRCFFERADQEVARAYRYQRPTVIAMLDVDHFKEVNDQYGHVVGDEVLRIVARMLRDNVRSHDVVGRVGGEEFAIVMPETQLEEGRELCERLRRAVAAKVVVTHGHEVSVTVSIGLSAVEAQERGISGAMTRADKALYGAKHQGRDQIAEQ